MDDRSGENKDATDVVGTITSCGTKGVVASMIWAICQVIDTTDILWLPYWVLSLSISWPINIKGTNYRTTPDTFFMDSSDCSNIHGTTEEGNMITLGYHSFLMAD